MFSHPQRGRLFTLVTAIPPERPAGRRCLVSAKGGVTKAQRRTGRPYSFPSSLPGGSRMRSKIGSCELDCIWSEEQQTYYVLDLLSWRGQPMADCTSEFRFFWMQNKLAEV